jgi:proline iminopeptidase
MKHRLGILLGFLGLGCLDSGAEGQLVPRTVSEDSALPSVPLRDGRLVHLQTRGEVGDPVVIVLHGGPGGDHRDLLVLEALAED